MASPQPNAGATPPPTGLLAQLMREKRRVLTQLHQIGQRQGQLVASGDVASLLKLLAAKQKLLGGLQSLERDLAPFRDEDPDARVWESADHRAACAADAAECRRLLAEVVEMEREHEQRMTDHRDTVATRLRRANSAHAAAGAYQSHRRGPAKAAAPSAAAPGGIDLSSEA